MTQPQKMCGVILTGHGGPECLQWREDLPVPELGKRDVLIQVAAAAVNNTDINTRTAWYSKINGDSSDATWSGQALAFPRIQGADVCGTIVAVGEHVEKNRTGERVLIEPCIIEANGQFLETPWYFGSECDGGFAKYARVASRHAYRIESSLSDVELASFPCSYSTAENMLTRSNVSAGETVLVTGASGGVGSAAVQLAKARGARVVAVTSSSKSHMLHDIGADTTLDRKADYVLELGPNSIDVVLDLVAGPQWSSLFDVLRARGRYAVSGTIGGPIVQLDVRTLYLKDLSLFGCTVLEPEVFGNLIKRIEEGELHPLIAKRSLLKKSLQHSRYSRKKAISGKLY